MHKDKKRTVYMHGHGERGKAKLKKPTVSIRRTKGTSNEKIEDTFTSLLIDLGGISNIIPSGVKRVLIKPNLLSGEPWSTGITVHPFLVELLIKELCREDLDVIVGEGSGWGARSDESFEVTGVKEICRRLNVPLIDFKREKEVTVGVPDGLRLKEIKVDEIVPTCDFIISLAKMKTHCETIASLSLKNMKGLVTRDNERLRFHLTDVNRCLIDLNKTFTPGLAIVEGIVALEGIGPLAPGKPKNLGLLIGGTDPVAVDAICTTIMRIRPKDIRHIVLASEAGLGTMDVENIAVVGEKLDTVIADSYETPPTRIEDLSPFEEINIVNGSPCSNCIASLASYLHGYIDKENVYSAISELTILIGAKAKSRGTGKEIAIGNCLKRYLGELPYVPGCPPASDAYNELVKRGLLKGDFSVSTVDKECRIVDANSNT
jgi:uncharacterized protein (DUF362 family)